MIIAAYGQDSHNWKIMQRIAKRVRFASLRGMCHDEVIVSPARKPAFPCRVMKNAFITWLIWITCNYFSVRLWSMSHGHETSAKSLYVVSFKFLVLTLLSLQWNPLQLFTLFENICTMEIFLICVQGGLCWFFLFFLLTGT